MKIGNITKTNSKGQLVIPKEIRDALGITEEVYLNVCLKGQGVFIYPIKEVLGDVEAEASYVEILGKTRGAWGAMEDNERHSVRKRLELAASKRRKAAW